MWAFTIAFKQPQPNFFLFDCTFSFRTEETLITFPHSPSSHSGTCTSDSELYCFLIFSLQSQVATQPFDPVGSAAAASVAGGGGGGGPLLLAPLRSLGRASTSRGTAPPAGSRSARSARSIAFVERSARDSGPLSPFRSPYRASDSPSRITSADEKEGPS